MTVETIILAGGTILGSSVIAALIRSRDERRKETIERPALIDDANAKALENMRLVMEELRKQTEADRERLTALERELNVLASERAELKKQVLELEAEVSAAVKRADQAESKNAKLEHRVSMLEANHKAWQNAWRRELPDKPYPVENN